MAKKSIVKDPGFGLVGFIAAVLLGSVLWGNAADSDRSDIFDRILWRSAPEEHSIAPLRLYRNARREGFSDEEIRQSLLDRIYQSGVPAGGKNSYLTWLSAACALDLFRGDPLVEAAVLAATDTALYEAMFPNPAEFLKREIAEYGSDELLEEYREMVRKKYGTPKRDMEFFEKTAASRPRFKRESVSGVPGQDEGDSSPPPAIFKPDAWRPTQGEPPDSNPAGTIGPQVDIWKPAVLWPLGLGVAGLLAAVAGLVCRRRWIVLLGFGLLVAAACLYFANRMRGEKITPTPTRTDASQPGTESHDRGDVAAPTRFKPDA